LLQSRDKLKEQFELRINEFKGLWASESKVTSTLSYEVSTMRTEVDRLLMVEREVTEQIFADAT
jgi:hypothetical protein